MTTLAEEVVRRYHALEKNVTGVLGSFPLPALGDIDAVDLVTMIVTYFSPMYGCGSYRPVIDQMLCFKGISIPSSKLDEVYPAIHDFLNWVIETLRSKEG